MPRHRVINRRNVGLSRRSLSLTEEGYEAAVALAQLLGVSLGSVVDTALKEIAGQAPPDVIDALDRQGHLTKEERPIVEAYYRDGPKNPNKG